MSGIPNTKAICYNWNQINQGAFTSKSPLNKPSRSNLSRQNGDSIYCLLVYHVLGTAELSENLSSCITLGLLHLYYLYLHQFTIRQFNVDKSKNYETTQCNTNWTTQAPQTNDVDQRQEESRGLVTHKGVSLQAIL